MLIGFSGKAGSGKDTSADYLVHRFGFTKMSFAGPLKAMLATAGFPEPADRALKEAQIPGFDFSWREAAQKLGTEWGRALDPDIWLKVMAKQLELANHTNVCLSDVRFENEAALIRSLGGTVVHIGGKSVNLGANATHASEAGVMAANGDYLLDNSESHEYLYGQLDDLLKGLQ
jgi:hypothetical protein